MKNRKRPTWDGWYICEWECGRRFRRGYDYERHAVDHFWAEGTPAQAAVLKAKCA